MDDDDDTEEEFTHEPSVFSPDPNERKLARRLRIQRRAEAIRRQAMPEVETEEEVEPSPYQKQLIKSAEALEKLILEVNQVITNVTVASDCREADRRETLEIEKQKIHEQLQEEAAKAQEKFEEIAEKWADILQYNDPLCINEEINRQKEKCNELFKQKDEIIAMLKNEIKKAERNYGGDQKRQNEDITILAKRVEKQVTLMRHAYSRHLQLLEDSLMLERKISKEAANRRWEELYKKRDETETLNVEKKQKELEEFEEQCKELRRQSQETYRETKIKLDNDIEALEAEFEAVKVNVLVNSEKMDYNYQVLKRREDENIIIKSQLKRKINKMQDVINNIRAKSREYISNTNAQMEKLTEQIIKLQHYVLDTDDKADVIAKQSEEKFQELWDFNRDRINTLMEKISTIDQLLYEQHLGVKWKSPDMLIREKEDLDSYKAAVEYLEKEKQKKKELEPKRKIEPLKGKQAACAQDVEETVAYRKLLKQILNLISSRSSFLLDPILKLILRPYEKDEKTMVKIDGVFESLNVKEPKDINILSRYFLPYAYCPICKDLTESMSEKQTIQTTTESYSTAQEASVEIAEVQPSAASIDQNAYERLIDNFEGHLNNINDIIVNVLDNPEIEEKSVSLKMEEEMQDLGVEIKDQPTVQTVRAIRASRMEAPTCKVSCERHHPLMISPVYVLRALRDFTKEVLPHDPGPQVMASRLSNVRRTISRLLTEEDIKLFWLQFNNIFPPNKEQLWDGLMFGLKKYHEILKDRKRLNQMAVCLRQQNAELKYVLATYDPGDKKQKPPCPAKKYTFF